MEEEGISYFFEHERAGHTLNGPVDGHEVVVDFLEGNPDRPIVTGSVPGVGVMTRPWTIGMPMNSPGGNGHGAGAYMYIEDIIGGGTQNMDKGFEISDVSFGVSNGGSIGSATSREGSGKAGFHEFTITRRIDSETPIFLKDCAAGAHYKNVIIEMRKAGGKGPSTSRPYLQYTFKLVYVTKIDWSGSGDEGPEETVTFQYGQMDVRYQSQASDSGPSGALSSHYKSSALPGRPCPWCPY